MRLLILATALFAGCTTATTKTSITDESLIGTWECSPTTMHDPNFDLVVTTRTTNNSDHTYTELTTSVITPHGKPSITNRDQANGTWRLDGDVTTSTVLRVEFISSSDPTISKELGQQIQESQLKKKSVYQSKILAFDGATSRSVPLNSMYKEAAVESSCKRV